ncbi:MAG: DUF4286 family protein [Petrimonas sp.]|nr:DUF4286 family protein [Petrimonas sp.]
MIIYNTTYHVAEGNQLDFVNFMKEKFIPKAVESGLLTNPRLSRVFGKHEDDGYSFALEFTADNMAALEKWNDEHSRDVYALLLKGFADKVSGFTTLMQVVRL